MQMKIEGLEKLQKKLDELPRELHKATVRAMKSSTMLIQRRAMENAPVDTGRLRASITSRVKSAGSVVGAGPPVVKGLVGTNVVYAPFVEFKTRPHWPPPGALAGWARRHGIPEFLVARAIARRGTKARRYLGRALEQSKRAVIGIFRKAISDVLRAR